MPRRPTESPAEGRQPSLPFPEEALAISQPPAVRLVRHRRARRYILRVEPDGDLRVTIPRGGSRREALEFVARNEAWIARRRARAREAEGARRCEHGARLLFRGQPVLLAVATSAAGAEVRFADQRVQVPARRLGDLRTCVRAHLKRIAARELRARIEELADVHGLRVGRVSIRDQRSRWGSCSPGGNIALNWRLVQMPDFVRDYVLVHELMHLREPNHSIRFWRLVAGACVRHREARDWLRDRGDALR